VGRWFGAHTDTGLQEGHHISGAVGVFTSKLEGHGTSLAQFAAGANGRTKPSEPEERKTKDSAKTDAAKEVANTQANSDKGNTKPG
jgi:hypothetical protein